MIGGGFDTDVVAVRVLFVESGSKVCEVTAAVSDSNVPFATGQLTATVSMRTSTVPVAKDDFEHCTEPEFPGEGTVHCQPAGVEMELNVAKPAGISVVSETLPAASTIVFETVRLYTTVCPVIGAGA